MGDRGGAQFAPSVHASVHALVFTPVPLWFVVVV